VLLISILVPVIATQIRNEMVATNMSSSSEAAWPRLKRACRSTETTSTTFRYYAHNYGSPGGDAALTGWKQIGATDESFHYVPDPSRLRCRRW